MSTNQPTNDKIISTELLLEKWRELFAGVLAVLIVLGMFGVCWVAVQSLANPAQFQGAKDLLLIITPFVGVVLGYYFNKVTSDARAGALQRAADSASQAASNAMTDRDRAEAQAKTAQAQAEQMRSALSDVVTAADAAKTEQPGNLGVLGVEGGQAASNAQQIQLMVALERAKRTLSAQ